MFAQVGLGFDLRGLMIYLGMIGLGFATVVVGGVFAALGVQARLLKAPATRFFRTTTIFFLIGSGLLVISFQLG